MTALLTDNLPLLAGAPNGIKKLRELILDLAVRGKLVPQDPNDEPASELLKRIAEEKARLVAEGKIKRIKQESEPSGESESFDGLPCGWSKIAGQEIFIPRSGNSKLIKGKLFDAPAPDRYPGYSASGQDVWLKSWEHDGTAIIISAVGARCGKAFLASGKWSAIANTHIVWPLPLINEHYAMLILNNESYWIRSGGAQPFIKVGDTLLKKIALPPLAEQHRIVAKVDELMALCDRLEAQQADAGSAHAQLVQALLDSLTQARDAEDFAQSWQRLAEHFHTLFTTESSIDTLKQTLLQLAVMGKLVPQDSSDEPASELLKRIAEEKARLVAEGKIKKQKLLAEIAEEDKTFALPIGWEWARLDDVAHVFAGNAFKSEDFQENPGVRVIKITNAGAGEFIETEDYLPSGYEVEYSPFSVKKSDLILALTRPYISTGLKVSKCPPEYDGALLNQRVAAIRFFSDINSDFGFLFFSSPIVLSIYQERFGGSGLQPNLKMSDVTTLLVPIPPAEEQHRIVAKIDQLMALCDQLKARLNQARQVHEHLANALVEQAVA